MTFKLFLIAVFLLLGVLLVGIAIRLMRRRVRPNSLYGIRVRATFADEWVWYEANARGGRDLILLGLIQIGSAVLLSWLPVGAYLLLNVAVLAIGAIVCAVVSVVRADRLLQQRRIANK